MRDDVHFESLCTPKNEQKIIEKLIKMLLFGVKYVRRPRKVKDGRNIGKLGSEKRSLNDEVGPQRGDKDAPEAELARIALTCG